MTVMPEKRTARLAVLPGTGGLTRVTDKRKVRKDRADVFATRSEGVRGRQAVEWRLVDEVIPKRQWDETIAERAGMSIGTPGQFGSSWHALLAILDRLLVPGVRWFLRQRTNRVIDRLNTLDSAPPTTPHLDEPPRG